MTWSDVELNNIFSGVGTVIRSRVVLDVVTGQSAGYAFVMYDTPASAQQAITTYNNTIYDNKQIRVTYKNKKQSTPLLLHTSLQSHIPISTTPINTNLYVAGLPYNFTPAEFNDIFSAYGVIIESRLLHDRHNGLQRGVGFVRYDTIDSCYAAIQAWHNKPISTLNNAHNNQQSYIDTSNKQYLTVRFAVDKVSHSPLMFNTTRNMSNVSLVSLDSISTLPYLNTSYDSSYASETVFSPPHPMLALPVQPATLFVCHLATTVTDTDLLQLFTPFGILHSCCVMRDLATGQSKGYGFINYISSVDAQSAIDSLNGTVIHDKAIQISFKKKNYNQSVRRNHTALNDTTGNIGLYQHQYNHQSYYPIPSHQQLIN